jgi:hypothetical protein
MLLGTRVQFPPPPLNSHLREIASGFFHWIYINCIEKIRGETTEKRRNSV